MNDESQSVLRYATGEEVRVGDRISWRTLFGRRQEGTISYIPRRSAVHRDVDEHDSDWYFDLEDGTTIGYIYIPEQLQPPRRLLFIARGQPTSSSTSPPQFDEDDEVTWQDFTKLILVVVPFGVALILLVAYVMHR